jgi:hypothetical protein
MKRYGDGFNSSIKGLKLYDAENSEQNTIISALIIDYKK